MTRIDPSRIQSLISQNFDSARAPGQLDGRSVQVGQAPESRAQPAGSMFANKAKNLLDRAVTFVRSNSEQRAEQGIARGVKSFDKALGKLLDAMKPDNKGDVDVAKFSRRLDALSGSAKSATSRGVDYKALLEERLKQYAANLDPQALDGAHENNLSALKQLQLSSAFGRTADERQAADTRLEQLKTLSDLFEGAKDLALKKYVDSILNA